MISRRTLIGKAAIGAAAAVTLGAAGTAAARTRAAATRTLPLPTGDLAEPQNGQPVEPPAASAAEAPPIAPPGEVFAAPPPWDLLRPLAAGSVVAHGWRLEDLSPVLHGSSVVTLKNAAGRTQRVHLCGNDGMPQGLVYTRRVDLVVMNEGNGGLPTDERLAQAVAELAHVIARNETTRSSAVFAHLLPHGERMARFAAEGKLR